MALRALTLLCASLVVGLPARAQPANLCARAIAAADQLYVEQLYDEVEPVALECVYDPTATVADVQLAYRTLALAFIKQGEIESARQTIIKILGADYAYEPDILVDLPLYVALVDAVKDQLRVEGGDRVTAVPVSDLVDVNTGTTEELEGVSGIGPTLAMRIIEFRSQNGPFKTLDALEGVRGIGPRTLERMRGQLTVGSATQVFRVGGGVAADPAVETVPRGPLVNLNTASAAELNGLNGIGPVLAERIVEYRTSYGPFRRVQDVMEVRGIGPVKLEGFADQVTVE